ncbi:glycoside hydrolase family 36 protein [Cryobacterium arcticum]|uniref:Alpha-galactosidase n=1 Tax=Cryobacterium arcticum TaxID=670052 RepID=A0A317ZTV2_9MICO|nr:glycoside hydrolase family 36 protein [Cryobacterium arcticum]PXA68599.1 alpha-galactosidase [Cryobacterium arcticum]
MTEFSWRTDALQLTFGHGDEAPVALRSLRAAGLDTAVVADDTVSRLDQPLVEISATGHGRFPGSFRHVDTVLGRALRYAAHTETTAEGFRELRIEQVEPGTGLRVTSVFRADAATAAFQTWTVVDLDPELTPVGGARPTSLTLDFVSTFATGAFLADTGRTVDEFDLLSGENDWVAESRWSTRPLREVGLARIDRDVQHHPPRSRCLVSNRGSWSTGERLPTGALLCRDADYALSWQVEHNGPWSYEVGETRHGAYLLLAGPTDQENQWSTVITPGRGFTSVPASVGISGGGVDAALAVLTDQRRAIRLPRAADAASPVIFNDYMNTLMGDPTTAKLLPLIDAAAAVGADYFCVDAGWYAEGHWWDTVGAWEPAASRFPNGITEVIDHIRARGMVAGLWLEPEVIGVHSPLARSLPDDAFFSRGGIRVAEHGRHHLDLRSPAARAHLDAVVDRLVSDYGVGFFKLDYNTMAGPGTDAAGLAPGDGLLGHNRALLDWLDAVQARHPHLLIENCASGAMRMDYAMMSRLHLQSTSDQQDPVMYAPIAAAAPASLLPEQAGNWAYPQAGMPPELFTFSLVNAILGRMYLSGYINQMSPAEVDLVAAAVTAQKTVVADIHTSHAVWPLGLPGWEEPWVALGLTAPEDSLRLSLWRRPGSADTVTVPLPAFAGREIEVLPFFPAQQHGWTWAWDAAAGLLTVTVTVPAPTARVLTLRPL